VLLLTLGRLCLQNKQWGRAKNFFIASIAIKAEPKTYAELARLQFYLGDEKESQDSYEKGLLSAASTLLDVPVFAK
jgi:HemY protein